MLRRHFVFALPTAAWAAKLGTAAPPFEFVSWTGTKESIAKYRGKAVAIYFFNPG